MPTQTMTPTQEQLFKLLLEIDDICKRHDIEYFLDQGTILGLVRHGGFLPWDNDLDICMTEQNYDKFVAACQEDLDPKTRRFCDNRHNREFPTVFGHYIDTTCCRMTDRTPFWDYYCGQTIDVFCLVELPGDLEENRRISNLYFAYDEYVNQSFNHYKRKTEDIWQIYQDLYKREREIGRDAVLAECEAQIFGHHYDDCTMYMCTSARMHWNTFLPKSIYDNPRMMEWNGRKFRIPGDWYTMMAINYGDRFYEVPRNPIIHSEMSHTGIPVEPYVDDFMATTDKKKFLSDRLEAKNRAAEYGVKYNRIQTPLFKGLGAVMSHELDQRIADEGVGLMELVNTNTIEAAEKLEEILGDYLPRQKHTSVEYWRGHFGHSDDADCAIMWVLLVNYANVQGMIRLLQVRMQNGLPITTDMQRIMDAGMHFRRMKKKWYYHELSDGCPEEAWVWENLPHTQEVCTWHAMYDFYARHAQGTENAPSLDECLKEALELRGEFPGSDLVAKLLADTLLERNNAVCNECPLEHADEPLHANGADGQGSTNDITSVAASDCSDRAWTLALLVEIRETSCNGFLLSEAADLLAQATEQELAQARADYEAWCEKRGELPASKPAKPKPSQKRFIDLKAHLLALATEIDETCKELGIPYAQCTHVADWARMREQFVGAQCELHVMMRSAHAIKLKKALKAKNLPNRGFEDLSTNPELPFNHIRYIDTGTTLIDADSHVPLKLPGVAVVIHPLYSAKRGVLQRRREWGHAFLKGGWPLFEAEMSEKRWKAIEETRKAESLFGSKVVARYLYSCLKKDDPKAKELIGLDAPNKYHQVKVDASMLDEAEYRPFAGIELPLPHDLDVYLDRWSGKNWSKVDKNRWKPISANRIRCISSADMGFEETAKLFADRGVDINKLQSDIRELFLWCDQELDPWKKTADTWYARARLSRDRIDIYEWLLPHADELKAASDAGDVKKLEAILEESGYLERSSAFLTYWDLGLFITPQLFEYAKEVWASQGKDTLAKRIWEKVPIQHKEQDLAAFLSGYPRY